MEQMMAYFLTNAMQILAIILGVIFLFQIATLRRIRKSKKYIVENQKKIMELMDRLLIKEESLRAESYLETAEKDGDINQKMVYEDEKEEAPETLINAVLEEVFP